MNTVRLDARAKLNLTLDLLGKEGDYHLIDSLAITVDLSDRIVLKKKKGPSSVAMRGEGSENIPPEENHALRAAELFSETFSTDGAEIRIAKNIPIGAGLGGSSADAAGVLLGLARLYDVDPEKLKPLADALGSDTGYLLDGGFARLTGRGERVEFFDRTPELNVLLLLPKRGISTRECYRLSDETERAAPHTERALGCFLSGNDEWGAKLLANDLFPAAKKLCPETEEAVRALKELSPWGTNLTGSGSGVYAVFETRELCEWAKSRYRGNCRAFVLRTTPRMPKIG